MPGELLQWQKKAATNCINATQDLSKLRKLVLYVYGMGLLRVQFMYKGYERYHLKNYQYFSLLDSEDILKDILF